MNTAKTIVRFFLAWIALLVAQMVAGILVHVNTPTAPNLFRWLMLANALIVLALGGAAVRTEWRKWRLWLALFAIPAAITAINMLEGVIFLTNAKIDWRGIFGSTIVSYALAAALWTVIFRGAVPDGETEDGTFPERSPLQKAWRFVFCCAAYVCVYITAGLIVFPYVRDYYASQHIPSMIEIVLLQFFIRGPVFVLACLVLMRMFRMPRISGALAVGLAFTAIASVALIIPNPYFPDSVRWAHFCEVMSSNFVFGFVVAWVWGKSHRVANLVHATA